MPLLALFPAHGIKCVERLRHCLRHADDRILTIPTLCSKWRSTAGTRLAHGDDEA